MIRYEALIESLHILLDTGLSYFEAITTVVDFYNLTEEQERILEDSYNYSLGLI